MIWPIFRYIQYWIQSIARAEVIRDRVAPTKPLFLCQLLYPIFLVSSVLILVLSVLEDDIVCRMRNALMKDWSRLLVGFHTMSVYMYVCMYVVCVKVSMHVLIISEKTSSVGFQSNKEMLLCNTRELKKSVNFLLMKLKLA